MSDAEAEVYQTKPSEAFVEVAFAGRTVRMLTAKREWIKADLLARGAYQHPKPPLVMALALRRPGLVVDVGAGSGLYTLLAASASETIRLAAVEPHPVALEFLRDNLRLNGLEDRVRVVAKAVSDRQGSAELHVPDPSHGLLETSASLVGAARSLTRVETSTDTLDHLLDGAGEICLVKVTVEGHEAAVLRGAQATMEGRRPFVFLNLVLMPASDAHELGVWLAGLDYLVFRMTSSAVILLNRLPAESWSECILVPREEIALFRNICHVHTLDLVRRMSAV